jgi:hypothetical protein
MFMYSPGVGVDDVPHLLASHDAAWNTLPVTWSIAG